MLKGCVLAVFLISSGSEVLSEEQTAGFQGDYLKRFAETFDRGRLRTGWVKYVKQSKDGTQVRVSLVFGEERFYERSLPVSTSASTGKSLWFDGTHVVSAGQESNVWACSIWPFSQGWRTSVFSFLGQVYNYWSSSETFASFLEPAKTASHSELRYVDKRTNRKLTVTLDPADQLQLLPMRITSYLPDDKVLAEWVYQDWKLREGNVWLPEKCSYTVHWEQLPEVGREDESWLYVIQEARFNMPVHEAWFMPQFPEGCDVTDAFSETNRIHIMRAFDCREDFKSSSSAPRKPARVQ
jgi:hypothetical protein